MDTIHIRSPDSNTLEAEGSLVYWKIFENHINVFLFFFSNFTFLMDNLSCLFFFFFFLTLPFSWMIYLACFTSVRSFALYTNILHLHSCSVWLQTSRLPGIIPHVVSLHLVQKGVIIGDTNIKQWRPIIIFSNLWESYAIIITNSNSTIIIIIDIITISFVRLLLSFTLLLLLLLLYL